MMLFFFGLRFSGPPPHSYPVRTYLAYSEIQAKLATALKTFQSDCGRYPTTAEGLQVLITNSDQSSFTNWHGPYLDPAHGSLEDSWGHPYVYTFPAVYSTNGYDLYSLGPDGVSNSADDIGNWKQPPPPRNPRGLARRAEKWLPLIPLLFVVGMLTQLTFPNVRRRAAGNEWVDWLWFAIALLALLALVVPRISG